jgi:predicted nuclease of predicted toxin-antitoxin system
MRALIDHNLPRRLRTFVSSVQGVSGTTHVSDIGFDAVSDAQIWAWCQTQPTVLWTKVRDFANLASRMAGPTKVIWMKVGNLATAQLWAHLEVQRPSIERFIAAESQSLLLID